MSRYVEEEEAHAMWENDAVDFFAAFYHALYVVGADAVGALCKLNAVETHSLKAAWFQPLKCLLYLSGLYLVPGTFNVLFWSTYSCI